MNKILVPIDGSKYSKLALEKAIKLGLASSSDICLLNVVSNVVNSPYFIDHEYKYEISNMFTEQGERALEEGLELLKDYPGKVEKKIVVGDPANEIIDEAEEGNYDLVVMGSRGLTGLSRMMLGSVSIKVLNHVNSSVLIVK